MLGAEREGKRREGNGVVRAERQRKGGERVGETRRAKSEGTTDGVNEGHGSIL